MTPWWLGLAAFALGLLAGYLARASIELGELWNDPPAHMERVTVPHDHAHAEGCTGTHFAWQRVTYCDTTLSEESGGE